MIDIFTTAFLIGILLGFGGMFGAFVWCLAEDELAQIKNKNKKRYKIWKC